MLGIGAHGDLSGISSCIVDDEQTPCGQNILKNPVHPVRRGGLIDNGTILDQPCRILGVPFPAGHNKLIVLVHIDVGKQRLAVDPRDRAEDQVVEQLVSENNSPKSRTDHHCFKLRYRMNTIGMVLTLDVGPFNRNVGNRIPAFGFSSKHTSRQGAWASAELYDRKIVRPPKAFPLSVKGPGHDMAKERPDLWTRQKVTSAAGSTTCGIEAVFGVVQRTFKNRLEGQRTSRANMFPDLLVERGERCAQPPNPSSVTSETVSTRRGQTPKASVAKAVRPIAPMREAGIRNGAMSPSGASSAHIVRNTDR